MIVLFKLAFTVFLKGVEAYFLYDEKPLWTFDTTFICTGSFRQRYHCDDSRNGFDRDHSELLLSTVLARPYSIEGLFQQLGIGVTVQQCNSESFCA